MGRGKLFEAWSFRLAQPAPFDDPQYSGAKGVGLSRYNTAGSARKATLHAPTMRCWHMPSWYLPANRVPMLRIWER